ncbi:ABC transporter ATP-binding protein [Microcella humidisoli]|jgi:multidrug/hemolysin transport system ATP-binding protein|uniref:ABC transporter ATP-binding protein n=1 Tax=Microcella humidisoli TaxID=2963406 RepID=A0ABY5FVV8_9MICO|nr:ABC transporter ATP-binding protein [Microcella humidisoli]UTT62291.1 ABC transporter ATP-binding protein [Microcella humidisoli]
MTATASISVSGLTKRYGDLLAVDEVSFDVQAGSVFAFLGTNGAGKSTTIGCITTVLSYDAGVIIVDGYDARRDPGSVREQIGVVFQESMLDAPLTARENLATRARFYSADRSQIAARVAELSALIGLDDFLDRRYGSLSGGQRRRVDIARALLHSPSILFLDEPTAGLDPASRAIVWSTINDLRDAHGLTVFLTTHYMEETENADQVSIIERGRVIAHGSPAQLRARHSSSVLSVITRDRAAFAALASTRGFEVRERGEPLEVRVPDAAAARGLIVDHADDLLDFEFRHGSMDDVFIALTGREPDRGNG